MWRNMKDKHLLALYEGGWKRTRAFFRHPRQMMSLRAEIERRRLN